MGKAEAMDATESFAVAQASCHCRWRRQMVSASKLAEPPDSVQVVDGRNIQ